MKVSLVENKLEKENISSYILNDLNLWFEDEDAVKNYIEKSKDYIFLKASEKESGDSYWYLKAISITFSSFSLKSNAAFVNFLKRIYSLNE